MQTTYRPSTVTTQTQSTSTKNIVQPQTYISNSKPIYDQPPTHEAYNPEYDEALVAQVTNTYISRALFNWLKFLFKLIFEFHCLSMHTA